MTNSSSAPQAGNGLGNLLADRYATSLVDVSDRAGALGAVRNDLLSLESFISASSELRAFFKSPVHAKVRQKAVIDDIASKAGFHALTRNFLFVLVDNSRLKVLMACIAAFHREIARRDGQVDAYVRSATPLTPAQQDRLAQTLSASSGARVRLFLEVDPSLLGGVVVTMGSRMIDDSLRSKLSRLKQSMISNSSQTPSRKEA